MPLTLLDIAKRTGSDLTVGLIEEVLTVAPEFRTIPIRPIKGTTYRATFRTAYPPSGFRQPGLGVTAGASKYEQRIVPCYFLDSQLQVDEAIVRADDGSVGDILADEATGSVQNSFITIGKQVYDGKSADANGFSGFFANVDPAMVVDAMGAGGTTETAWAIYEDDKNGVHFPMGNDAALPFAPWAKQQVKDANNKAFMAYVSNLSAWLGLSLATSKIIGCVKNITAAKPLTDQLGNQLFSTFALGRQPTRWLMSRNCRYLLQQSRTAILYQKSDGAGSAYAPLPTELAGIPITVTDSIATRAAF